MLELLYKLMFWCAFPCGISLVFAIDAQMEGKEESYKFWAAIASFGFILGFIWWALGEYGKKLDPFYLRYFLIMSGVGACSGLIWMRFFPSISERFARVFTKKTTVERNKKTDVREIGRYLPSEAKKFDPRKFFTKKAYFVGLSEKGDPVTIPRQEGKPIPHIQIVGTTGVGKGVAMGVLAAQMLQAGEAVFMIDPKDDEYAPHLFAGAAAAAGVPHHFIDLRVSCAQFSLFEGASKDEIEEALIAGFGLGETGSAADFYAIADRKYAAHVAREIVDSGSTVANVYKAMSDILEKEAPKLAGKLRELAEVEAVNAMPGAGVSFSKTVADGGSCYIVGSMRSEKLMRVQKIILVRLLQITERRDRIAGGVRPVAIFLDELKYHLSRSALEALGAARDKGVHVVLAHQSLADLKDVGGDLKGDAVVGSVVENCAIKVCYRVQNPETAEWLARMTGSILVDDETRTVSKNAALTEKVNAQRTIRQSERYLVDVNQFLQLPAMTAVVIGLGVAQFAAIRPLRVEKSEANITPMAVAGQSVQAAEELI